MGVRGDEAAEAAAEAFLMVTVFVLILGLFAFINIAGGGAGQEGRNEMEQKECMAARRRVRGGQGEARQARHVSQSGSQSVSQPANTEMKS